MYGFVVLQILLLYTRLYSSKIYLNPLDVDQSPENTNEMIVMRVQDPMKSKSLTIEDLEPSKSLVVNPSVKDDLTVEGLKLNKAQKNILRKRWQSSCDKKASKVCVKACKSTVAVVCSSYKCRKSMKRNFKKECKRNCKARFMSSKDSDTE